jgi:hypothetical protein
MAVYLRYLNLTNKRQSPRSVLYQPSQVPTAPAPVVAPRATVSLQTGARRGRACAHRPPGGRWSAGYPDNNTRTSRSPGLPALAVAGGRP